MIDGNKLRDAILAAASCLEKNKHRVDELNVFPVPDGDTGTNMSMTLSNAVGSLSNMENATVYEVINETSKCLLRGARGNSGVILSLMFRGFAKEFKDVDVIDSAVMAQALTMASNAAYKAVMKPTEGTILTVLRGAAEAATEKAGESDDLLEVFECACCAAHKKLDETPEILPVLKKAGVVDSGGAGLCIILDAMLASFKGEVAPDAVSDESNFEKQKEYEIFVSGEFVTDDSGQIKACRAYIESCGEMVQSEISDKKISFVLKTDNPVDVLSGILKYAVLREATVKQNVLKKADKETEAALPEKAEPVNKYGFVAVAAGDGVVNLFKDLGADIVVEGGQTMNPSTQDILNAIEATPAKTVFVLPNNKNIIMSAEQAIPMASRQVYVLPTRSIPMGIGAIMAFDEEASAEKNLTDMRLAAENTDSGLITYAVRDSEYENHSIRKGEIMALKNNVLEFVEADVFKAACKIIKSLVKKSTTTIMVIYGEGVTEEQATMLTDYVSERYKDAEVMTVCGNQPVYHYIIGVD